MHCPGGNATDPIWRVFATSDAISPWTPLKPQHSNPLANQLWCIDFLTPPTPLIIPHTIANVLHSFLFCQYEINIHIFQRFIFIFEIIIITIIIFIIIIFLANLLNQRRLMLFHWSLKNGTSPQVSRSLLSILSGLSYAVVWLVLTRHPIFNFFTPLNKP